MKAARRPCIWQAGQDISLSLFSSPSASHLLSQFHTSSVLAPLREQRGSVSLLCLLGISPSLHFNLFVPSSTWISFLKLCTFRLNREWVTGGKTHKHNKADDPEGKLTGSYFKTTMPMTFFFFNIFPLPLEFKKFVCVSHHPPLAQCLASSRHSTNIC